MNTGQKTKDQLGIGERIKLRRKALGITAEQLGDMLGKNRSTIYRYENGEIEKLPMDILDSIAQALRTTPRYLLGWNETVSDKAFDGFSDIPNIFQVKTERFPLLGEIACGEPILAEEHVDIYVSASSGLHADFCLRAKGDSMVGARIYDGDIVFVRKQDTVEDGEIAAVLIDGEATLKRVYYDRELGVISLFAENPQYKTMRYSGEQLNQIRILGKAVAFQSDVR